ncbi:MAG: fumarate hydratase [Clostridiaceae bacterium]|jgi:fumarate hydratase subunit alpha|nr:fumarate hydratase [Clostridiaceae bacterium]
MKVINASQITETVERLCIEANCELNSDIMDALEKGIGAEESETGRRILCQLVDNARTAAREGMAICQDTGMAVVFVEIGQDVHVAGGSLSDAINEGVRRGYEKGFLRKSVVSDPLERINTNDNTPAVIHYDIVGGEGIKITVAPKGFGSENMSGVRMLKPSEGIDGVRSFILEMVDRAGPNPCPPVVVGVGIGGTMEKAALLAKKALLRPVDMRNADSRYKELEEELLERINRLGIGPAGLGGRLTAMAVNIEVYPTHIAGLPVALNMSCHVTRHAEAVL